MKIPENLKLGDKYKCGDGFVWEHVHYLGVGSRMECQDICASESLEEFFQREDIKKLEYYIIDKEEPYAAEIDLIIYKHERLLTCECGYVDASKKFKPDYTKDIYREPKLICPSCGEHWQYKRYIKEERAAFEKRWNGEN